MNQISFLSEVDHIRRQQEILREMEGYRLLNDALKARKSSGTGKSKILAWVGRQFSSMGFALEERYGIQFTATATGYPQSNPGSCD
jgi:hypothetical protein